MIAHISKFNFERASVQKLAEETFLQWTTGDIYCRVLPEGFVCRCSDVEACVLVDAGSKCVLSFDI